MTLIKQEAHGLVAVAQLATEQGRDHVEVNLDRYAWVRCGHCQHYGRYFDAGYLAGFIEQHALCIKQEVD